MFPGNTIFSIKNLNVVTHGYLCTVSFIILTVVCTLFSVYVETSESLKIHFYCPSSQLERFSLCHRVTCSIFVLKNTAQASSEHHCPLASSSFKQEDVWPAMSQCSLDLWTTHVVVLPVSCISCILQTKVVTPFKSICHLFLTPCLFPLVS